MKKIFALTILAAVLAIPAFSQQEMQAANFTYIYDVDSATATYCNLTGMDGDPYGPWIPGKGTIETSGSSTTITGVVAADDVFEPVGVGDAIQVVVGRTTYYLTVVTNADNDTITVNTAVDLSAGYVWSWKNLTCGTAVTNGWVTVAGYDTITMGVHYVAGDLDTLDVFWECRTGALGAQPQRVYPGVSSDCGDGTLSGTVCKMSTAGQDLTYRIEDNAGTFHECRIGLAYGSTDASDAGANLEQVTATVSVGR